MNCKFRFEQVKLEGKGTNGSLSNLQPVITTMGGRADLDQKERRGVLLLHVHNFSHQTQQHTNNTKPCRAHRIAATDVKSQVL